MTQSVQRRFGDPWGTHRVLDSEPGRLPQAADRLDATPELWSDEVRIRVERLNLDSASFRQMQESLAGDPEAVRAEVLGIVRNRGKMQNPVTGSGGMLIGTVEEVGPDSPLGLAVGQRVATLVSLTLTPLQLDGALNEWDGASEQVPCQGHAILFGSSIAAALPTDLPERLALSVFDVCGAPALTRRTILRRRGSHDAPVPVRVLVIGAAGKSGGLCLQAARDSGASEVVAAVLTEQEAARVSAAGLADRVVVGDARGAVDFRDAVCVEGWAADVSVVCVNVPGCEATALGATAAGGTVVFFSMATSFSAAALGAEGMAADVEMLIGNGYVPGHADYALGLVRQHPGLRSFFEEDGR